MSSPCLTLKTSAPTTTLLISQNEFFPTSKPNSPTLVLRSLFASNHSTFQIHTRKKMPPFYPYIPPAPANITHTNPCSPPTLAPRAASPPISLSTIEEQNATGTSLSTTGIICIVAVIVFVFGGLAWFVWHMLGVPPNGKKEKSKEHRRKRKEAERHTERATKGVGHGGIRNGESYERRDEIDLPAREGHRATEGENGHYEYA